MRKRHIVALAALILGSASAQAQPVRVDYTVSGVAGNWQLNFTLFNDMNGAPLDMGLYLFGVQVGAASTTGSPAGWSPLGYGMTPPTGTTFDHLWVDYSYTGILAGQSRGGFSVTTTGSTAPGSVTWLAYGLSPSGHDYSGEGTFTGASFNPGFQGSSIGSFHQVNIVSLDAPLEQPPVTVTPEPSTYALLASGLAMLSYFKRRRRVTLLHE